MQRPAKPYPGFPLHAHSSGQWAKKVHGRRRYFGVWADPQAALDKWLAERDTLLAGGEPRSAIATVTVADVVNGFLTERRGRVDAGEMTARTWSEYYATGVEISEAFGRARAVGDLRPADFARLRARAAKRLGPVALGNFVQRVRTIFRWGDESLDCPARFGPDFAKPAARVVRLERARRGPRLVEPGDVRKLLGWPPSAPCDLQLAAMILLGVNCGFGQTDCAELPRDAVKGPWLDFPRPKTGVGRRCRLWPETVAAIAAVPTDGHLVFLTRYGRPWVRWSKGKDGKHGARTDAVGQEFAKRCAAVGVEGVSFYDCRRTFRTVADATGDHVAVGLVMGHHDPSVGGIYRQAVDDARLAAVAAHVRRWLDS